MSGERREIYRFRYKDPYHIRKRITYAERIFQLVREERIGKNITWYQVMATFTGAQKDDLEKELGTRFRSRIYGSRSDAAGTVNEILDHLNGEI